MYFNFVVNYSDQNFKLEIKRSNNDLLVEITDILCLKEKLYEVFKKTRISYSK